MDTHKLQTAPNNERFHPTVEMLAAAESLFMAMAMEATIRPIVVAYQTRILKSHRWRIRPDLAFGQREEIITDPALSYLLSDENFREYAVLCRSARDDAGLLVEKQEQCPLLMAEHAVIKAKHALIDVMSGITKITATDAATLPIDKYKEFVDLTLRLLAPYLPAVPVPTDTRH